MNTSKSVTRLRAVRKVLDHLDKKREEGGESGFTLIELMVVLLIMAILLAIAIPTFLGVTAGAKKTATQSDLTNAVTSATALYTNTQKFPATATFAKAMHKTQTTIAFVSGTTAPAGGKNSISAYTPTSNVAFFSAVDGTTACWVVVMNESSSTVTVGAVSIPPGTHFYGAKKTKIGPATCYGSHVALTAATKYKTNFKTITGVT